MADVVISEMMHPAAVASLREHYDVHYDPALCDDATALHTAVATARALIVRNRTQVRGDLLDAASALRVVGRLGVGLDNIDVADCESRNIEVCPATGANAVAVAEYVITAALLLLRGAYSHNGRVIAGEWPRTELVGNEIGGKCMGLVGFGATARAVGERARALGMTVVAHDPFLRDRINAEDATAWAELPELLGRADVVSLHVPLTPQTRYLLDAERIAAMRPRTIVINTARGGIVDENALIDALRDGRLAGAALDVFEHEPLEASTGARFRDVPGLLLTPHIAGVTEESNINVSAVTAENVRRVLATKP